MFMSLAINDGGGRRGPRRQPSGSQIAAPVTGEVDYVRGGQVRRYALASTNEPGSSRRGIDAQRMGGDDVQLEVTPP